MKTDIHFWLFSRSVLRQELYRNQNTHFVVSNCFEKNRAVYEIMWKITVEPDRPQMTIWRMRIACRTTKAKHTHTHTHIHTISNNYCFSTATMVERTRHNVTFMRTLSALSVLYIRQRFLLHTNSISSAPYQSCQYSVSVSRTACRYFCHFT
jgi:hypothetical protein